MTVLPLISYPDPRLWEKSKDVDAFDPELRTLADDLLDTMHAAPGVGITACHVGILKRLTVIELEAGKPRIYVNPRVSWSSSDLSEAMEGSVSMPGATETLKRPARIRVVYCDLEGQMLEDEADSFLATCLQHEIDQLDGIFWLDRLTRLKRERVIKRYKKLRG